MYLKHCHGDNVDELSEAAGRLALGLQSQEEPLLMEAIWLRNR